MSIETIRFNKPMPYAEVYSAQVARRTAIEKGEASNALFLVEHERVYTMGRKADVSDLLTDERALKAAGFDVQRTDRGGEITYHGPGQLVAYPILNLGEWKRSIGWYLRTLEQVLIRLLDRYNLQATRMEGLTGVWVEGAKVAAIGIGIHNWTTYHGIALNVDPDMSHWENIVPCGIADKPVTSLRLLLTDPPSMSQAMDDFERVFREIFEEENDTNEP